jgi:alkylation response protein AidB-like acyl-CoA dehydrogenase
MNFDLSEEQTALQDLVVRFGAERLPISEARRWGQPGGFDRERWAQLAALGVFALAPMDGSGSLADAVVAFEAMGHGLVPGPLIAAGLAGGTIDGVESGATVVTLVDRSASPMLAPHLLDADLVLALDDGGVWVIPVGDTDAVEVESTDPTATVWLVEHLPRGEQIADEGAVEHWRASAGLLASSLLTGLADGAIQQAVAYAQRRWQFGRPIGAFQALKHLLADSFARVELARASLYSAALRADDLTLGGAVRSASGCRFLATEAARHNTKAALQIFGGMGFTWEMDAHLYVKRVWATQAVQGSSERSLDTLAQELMPA